jgi:hypothetical protein
VARAPSIEQQIAAVRALDLTKPKAVDVLRDSLATHAGRAVAIAAERIAEHPLPHLAPELADAFVRLCDDGAKRDPQCVGKVAIVRALHALDGWDDRVFVHGLRYEQQEGWSGPGPDPTPPDDTAAELRGLCGLVHAECSRPDALDVLAELLLDPEHITRRIAARALGDAGRPDASALLRYKILTGDPESEVLAACFESLFALSREDTTPFALRFLERHDDVGMVAALALGAARIAGAFEPLARWCTSAPPALRYEAGYLALALLRSDRATDWLVDVVATRPKPDAIAAMKALATFAGDPAFDQRLRDAAAKQKDARARREILAVLAR